MHRFTWFLLLLLPIVSPAADPDAPLPPDKAVAAMKLPEGFRVGLVAAEPQLIKPIAMTTDDRGRLWVIESHSYPHWLRDGKEGTDRILIFEDKGNGRYDCTVFWDKGTNLSGIALGFGGVWLCSAPNLIFIPVKPGEDKPAGPAKILLDGWSLDAKHNVFNGILWGPDGWLYGLNGITATSHVGKPGTPKKDRTPMNCGVWRYHPTKDRFEVFAWGTTNPWGIDFDDHGEMFITNCVIKHIFHVVPGAHFVRMFGEDLSPHCYGLIESCADHIHWAGGAWGDSRGGQGAHSVAGGGHAHAGCLVYLGDNWPAEYRNRVFMCNVHGNRLNQDVLEHRGSGYVAKHAPDFLMANDPWFRGLHLIGSADGGVFVSDWCDTGECHNYDKTSPRGRVYKVTFGQPKHVAVDLAKLGDEELVKLQLHKNDWYVRTARRLLQERAAAGKLSDKAKTQLEEEIATSGDVSRSLRTLWAFYSIGGDAEPLLTRFLYSQEAPERRWAVRLLAEEKLSDATAARLAKLAKQEPEAPVRLALASALQRLPAGQRWPIAEALAQHQADWNDPYLPHMLWYGIEQLVPGDPERAMDFAANARIPLVRHYIARRLAAADNDRANALLVQGLIAAEKDTDRSLDLLRGMYAAWRGQRAVKMPAEWATARDRLLKSPHAEVKQKTLMLSVIFGDQEALGMLRSTASDGSAVEADRRAALQTLIEVRAPDLVPLLHKLVNDSKVRGPALRGLAAFNDPATPEVILKQYASFSDADKSDAVTTLASRPEYAHALLDAIAAKKLPPRDLSVFTARQILGFKDKKLAEKLNDAWGTIRATAGDKVELLRKYRALVPPDVLAKADRLNGRALYAKTCASCHVLFGEGGKIGPDLTGSQRANPEYLLTKILDPNAAVAKDYQVSVIATTSGRVLTGIVTKEDEKTLTVQTQNELLVLPKSEIEERKKTMQSIMPEGQLAQMSEKEVRDLIAYLTGAEQVALPKKD